MDLPLQREKDRHHGSYFRNCRFVDAIRRSVLKRLPHGAVEKIAEALLQFDDLLRLITRIQDEHSGQTRYSMDVFVADLIQLRTDDARHVLQKLARPLGLWVVRSPFSPEESA
jgi:hypothetical protein